MCWASSHVLWDFFYFVLKMRACKFLWVYHCYFHFFKINITFILVLISLLHDITFSGSLYMDFKILSGHDFMWLLSLLEKNSGFKLFCYFFLISFLEFWISAAFDRHLREKGFLNCSIQIAEILNFCINFFQINYLQIALITSIFKNSVMIPLYNFMCRVEKAYNHSFYLLHV